MTRPVRSCLHSLASHNTGRTKPRPGPLPAGLRRILGLILGPNATDAGILPYCPSAHSLGGATTPGIRCRGSVASGRPGDKKRWVSFPRARVSESSRDTSPWAAALSSVDGALRRGLQRQAGQVLALGIPVRRQRPADEVPRAGGVARAIPEPPGMAQWSTAVMATPRCSSG